MNAIKLVNENEVDSGSAVKLSSSCSCPPVSSSKAIMYRSRMPFALAGGNHVILIEVESVAMTVRSRGALGTE